MAEWPIVCYTNILHGTFVLKFAAMFGKKGSRKILKYNCKVKMKIGLL